MEQTAALIVAAGRGERAGGPIAKQWQRLAGRRVADWTIEQFRKAPQISKIVLVLPKGDRAAWDSFADQDDLILCEGGSERASSVKSGLAALADTSADTGVDTGVDTGATRVLIHDVARPCVSQDLIRRVATALDTHAAAAPGLPVTDALWTGADDQVTGTQDRSGLFAAQTPQGFHYDLIASAHASCSAPAADDVEVARLAGHPVAIVAGDADNLKITRPEDFARAERILRQNMDVRLGNGYDVHRFGDGAFVTLCGVEIPHTRGLQGHSDADVGMHAVTDAIYGALAEGDIGQHFPPSDPQWKGAASEIFLRHAVDLATERGYRIGNIDCTLVCEYPKIGPHAATMRAEMARIMGLDLDQVSVKATTSERLGFTGREEGIASLATATLVRA